MLYRTIVLPAGGHPTRLVRNSHLNIHNILRRYTSNQKEVLGAPKSASTPPAVRLNPAAPVSTRTDARFRKFNFVLSQSPGPVEIYKAPPQRSYIIGAYSITVFCFLYSGYNFYDVSVNPLIQAAQWQKYTFGAVCVIMAAMGTVVFKRASNLIASITAIKSQTQTQTQLSIKVRRMIPFRKQREIIATPDQLSFKNQLVVPYSHLNEEGRAKAQQRWEAERQVSEQPFYKVPIKRLNLAVWRFFMNTRRLFTQEHFVYTQIEGTRGEFRLDAMGGLSEELVLLEKSTKLGV